MKKFTALAALLLLSACGALATTESTYYIAADAPSERACDGPPSRAALDGEPGADGTLVSTINIRIFDDVGLLCEFGPDNKLVATYAEVDEGGATHVYTVVDDPMAANPVKTFGPIGE